MKKLILVLISFFISIFLFAENNLNQFIGFSYTVKINYYNDSQFFSYNDDRELYSDFYNTDININNNLSTAPIIRIERYREKTETGTDVYVEIVFSYEFDSILIFFQNQNDQLYQMRNQLKTSYEVLSDDEFKIMIFLSERLIADFYFIKTSF